MSNLLNAILQWFDITLLDWLRGVWRLLGKVRWFAVALAGVFVSLVELGIKFFAWAGENFAAQTEQLLEKATGFAGSSPSFGAISTGAGLLNCVLPLDYMIAAGGVVLGFYFIVSAIVMLIALYRLIPFKFT